jgi:two-component system heavy metal sensor histidine kinase CusS
MLWYALWAFALIAAASGLLYGGLETRLEREQEDRTLTDHLRMVSLFLQRSVLTQEMPEPTLPKGVARPSSVHVRVLDRAGRLLVETAGISEDLPLPTAADLRSGFRREGDRRTVRSRSGRLFEVLNAQVTVPEANGGLRYVQVAMDRTDDDLLDTLRDQSWWTVTMTILACAVVAYTIAQRSVRPVERFSQAVERIQSNHLHERIDSSGLPHELSGLAATFNQMLDRMEEAFGRVAQFSDNVAHELRSPIGALQTELEIALSKPRTDEEYRGVLCSCLEECSRITRILHSLLFLARGSTSESVHTQWLQLRDEVQSVFDVYGPWAAELGVRLICTVPASLAVCADRVLLRQALANLVANAIEHTGLSGEVAVTALWESRETSIRVQDTGCGIAPEHLSRVFDRFFRVEAARSESRRHVGLGLAIVKSIVEQHGGSVSIDSRLHRGTCVTLRLPHSRA